MSRNAVARESSARCALASISLQRAMAASSSAAEAACMMYTSTSIGSTAGGSLLGGLLSTSGSGFFCLTSACRLKCAAGFAGCGA